MPAHTHHTYMREKEKRFFFQTHPSTGPFSILNTHAKNFWTWARMLNEGSEYLVIKSNPKRTLVLQACLIREKPMRFLLAEKAAQ